MKRLVGAVILGALTVIGVVQGVVGATAVSVLPATQFTYDADPKGPFSGFVTVATNYYTFNGWALLAVIAGALLIALVAASLATVLLPRVPGWLHGALGFPGGTWQYDTAGAPVSWTRSEPTTTTMEYDAQGELLRSTRQRATMEYDATGTVMSPTREIVEETPQPAAGARS